MRLDTTLNILNDTLLELSMITSASAAPYTSTDPMVVSARYLLKALGEELVRLRNWSHLQKTHTFATAIGTDNYALPADFLSMLHSSEWNRTTGIRLAGPVGPAAWQVYKSSLNAFSSPDYVFRVYGNRLYLFETPTAVETVAYEYQSAYWVQPTGQTTPTTEAPTTHTDTPWFDRHLLVRGLKAKVLEAKGFDSSAARNDFERALAEASGNDGAHAVLSLSPRRHSATPHLPETGWGS